MVPTFQRKFRTGWAGALSVDWYVIGSSCRPHSCRVSTRIAVRESEQRESNLIRIMRTVCQDSIGMLLKICVRKNVHRERLERS